MRAIAMALPIARTILCNGPGFACCYDDFECGYGTKCVTASRDINFTGVCHARRSVWQCQARLFGSKTRTHRGHLVC
jgi:hypothetical protein